MSPFDPKCDVKLQGRAIAHYRGPKTPKDPEYDNHIGRLHEYLLRNHWQGHLEINYTGNGGVQDVLFTEIKPATEIKT